MLIFFLEQKIKKFIANVYNSMMWFEFEDNICRAIKTRRPLTTDAMLSIYQELYIKYNPEVVPFYITFLPSTISAFRLVHRVVDATRIGAVPVATVEFN